MSRSAGNDDIAPVAPQPEMMTGRGARAFVMVDGKRRQLESALPGTDALASRDATARVKDLGGDGFPRPERARRASGNGMMAGPASGGYRPLQGAIRRGKAADSDATDAAAAKQRAALAELPVRAAPPRPGRRPVSARASSRANRVPRSPVLSPERRLAIGTAGLEAGDASRAQDDGVGAAASRSPGRASAVGDRAVSASSAVGDAATALLDALERLPPGPRRRWARGADRALDEAAPDGARRGRRRRDREAEALESAAALSLPPAWVRHRRRQEEEEAGRRERRAAERLGRAAALVASHAVAAVADDAPGAGSAEEGAWLDALEAVVMAEEAAAGRSAAGPGRTAPGPSPSSGAAASRARLARATEASRSRQAAVDADRAAAAGEAARGVGTPAARAAAEAAMLSERLLRRLSRGEPPSVAAAVAGMARALRQTARSGDLSALVSSGVPGAAALARRLVDEGLVSATAMPAKRQPQAGGDTAQHDAAAARAMRRHGKAVRSLAARPAGQSLRPASAATTRVAATASGAGPSPGAMTARFGTRAPSSSGVHRQDARLAGVGDVAEEADPASGAGLRMAHWAPDTRRALSLSGRLLPYSNLKRRHLERDLALPQPSSAARHSGADLPAAPPKPGTLESLTLHGGAAMVPAWRAAALLQAEARGRRAREEDEDRRRGVGPWRSSGQAQRHVAAARAEGLASTRRLSSLLPRGEEGGGGGSPSEALPGRTLEGAADRTARWPPGTASPLGRQGARGRAPGRDAPPPTSSAAAAAAASQGVATGMGLGALASAPVPVVAGAALLLAPGSALARSMRPTAGEEEKEAEREEEARMRSTAGRSQALLLGAASAARRAAATMTRRPPPGTLGRTRLVLGSRAAGGGRGRPGGGGTPTVDEDEDGEAFADEMAVLSPVGGDSDGESDEVEEVAEAGRRGVVRVARGAGPAPTVAELYGVVAVTLESGGARGAGRPAAAEGMAWRGVTGRAAAPRAGRPARRGNDDDARARRAGAGRAARETSERRRRRATLPPRAEGVADARGAAALASRIARRSGTAGDLRAGAAVTSGPGGWDDADGDRDAEPEPPGRARLRRREAGAAVSLRRAVGSRARLAAAAEATGGTSAAQRAVARADASGPAAALAASLAMGAAGGLAGGAGGSDGRTAADRLSAGTLLPPSRRVREQAARSGASATRPVSAARQRRRQGGSLAGAASVRYDQGLSRRLQLLGMPADAPDDAPVRAQTWQR